MTRKHSLFACRQNILNLPGKHSIMWTFTFREMIKVKDAVELWGLACKALVEELGFYGVRVFQLHPGQFGDGGHGLHIHFATSDEFRIDQVKKIVSRYGFGRVNVVKRTRDRLNYLTKELLHDWYARGWAKGKRLWQCVGDRAGWVRTRCKDVEIQGYLFEYCQQAKSEGWRRIAIYKRARSLWLMSMCGIDQITLAKTIGRFWASDVGESLADRLGKTFHFCRRYDFIPLLQSRSV